MPVCLLGAVLAGGASSRFGSDKAQALWRGRPLIDHAIAALEATTSDIVLCGGSIEGRTTLGDRPESGLGPLGGLNAALHHALAHGYDGVLTVGCDTPLLPVGLLTRLSEGDRARFVADLPVIGHWPAGLAPVLDAFLATDNKRSIRGWAAAAGAEPIACSDIPNINRPADLRALEKGGG